MNDPKFSLYMGHFLTAVTTSNESHYNDCWPWRLVSIPVSALLFYVQLSAKHSFASAVYATANPSVHCPSVSPSVCLSVTLRCCVKTRERRKMWSSPSGSPVPLVFWCQEWLMGDDPVQVKLECKEVDHCENSRDVGLHISPHNSGTVIDSEKSSINVNRKLTMGFPNKLSTKVVSRLTFPKWRSDTQICRFYQKFRPENIKSLLQSFSV